MGKGRRHKPKKNFAEKRREKLKKKNEWDTAPHHNYADIIRENKDFENYYKTQKIVPEEQWDSFINTMRKNLPVAFRITGSKIEAKALIETIKGDFFKEILNTNMEDDSENNEEAKDILQCLPFYPDGLAWQLQLTRKDIRRSEAYFRLHNFLIVETESGNISRQEVVSMVPPLVLDVKPSHKVLDMCAAPGSKTAQLIEMIHCEESSALPEGFVIANDLDNNRCYMLVHQAKRLNSPIILITNHDASVLPNFTTTKPDGTKEQLKFDRILADVPCSGDGTMRKNPDIWCKWSPANGNNLHGIQYRIARRGLELLAVGGRMVYSTCSLNPIENEAVLHRLLVETQDSVQLVSCRDLVPGLVCDPGISHWLPVSKDLQYYESWEDVPEQWQTQVHPKMFPPKPEDAAKFHFERCMRILPHHQDTGGFFVAVLEKINHLPWERGPDTKDEAAENELGLEQETKKNVHGKRSFDDMNRLRESRRKRRRIAAGYKEDPFVFFKDDKEDVWLSIKNFYNISDDLDPRCLLVRCLGRKKKNIYYTSPEIRNVVLSNEDQIKLINTGVKSFVRCDNKNMDCPFRLAQEGIQIIIKYIGDARKIKISKDDLIMLLQNNNPQTPPEIVKLNTETQERLQDFATGSCILVYEEEGTEKPLKLQMVGWRGTMSLRAYVPVHDAIHYLRLLGADCSKFEKNKFKENRPTIIPDELTEEMINEIENENENENDDHSHVSEANCSKFEEDKLQEDRASTVPKELNNEVIENVKNEKNDHTDILEADSSNLRKHKLQEDCAPTISEELNNESIKNVKKGKYGHPDLLEAESSKLEKDKLQDDHASDAPEESNNEIIKNIKKEKDNHPDLLEAECSKLEKDNSQEDHVSAAPEESNNETIKNIKKEKDYHPDLLEAECPKLEKDKLKDDHASVAPEESNNEIIKNIKKEKDDHSDVLGADCLKLEEDKSREERASTVPEESNNEVINDIKKGNETQTSNELKE